mgnify:CR=1 FL=1
METKPEKHSFEEMVKIMSAMSKAGVTAEEAIKNLTSKKCTVKGADDGVLRRLPGKKEKETIDHPSHYNQHPSGIECIDIVEHMGFNIGNAIKYVWREGLKGVGVPDEDIRKAIWYLDRELLKRKTLRNKVADVKGDYDETVSDV